jgi:hypothetical protein
MSGGRQKVAGKIIDFNDIAIKSKEDRIFIREQLEEAGNELKAMARQIGSMTINDLTALFLTVKVSQASGILRRCLHYQGEEITQQAQEVFQTLMSLQMDLGLFYADRLGIDTEKAFAGIMSEAEIEALKQRSKGRKEATN